MMYRKRSYIDSVPGQASVGNFTTHEMNDTATIS